MVFNLFRRNIFDLPASVSLSYFWCSGFMLGSFLVFQVFTGIILSFMFACGEDVSFSSAMNISNDSLFGWAVRYFHVWGVSVIFILLLVHIGRALYYSSYAKGEIWTAGFVLYMLMMIEAFLGYILPWHQMSYWAATVLTSILEVVPFLGSYFFTYVVGGFSVTGVTLARVFSLHVWLAFVVLGFSLLHMLYLHGIGSSSPLLTGGGYSDAVFFHGLYTVKDSVILWLLVACVVLFMWMFPMCVLDVEGYIEADPLVTPVSIKPEWYFLFYYAMLRSVGSKLGGLVLVLVFLFILWFPGFNVSCVYSLIRQTLFWLSGWFFVVLCFLGGCHPERPFVFFSMFISVGVVVLFCFFKLGWSFSKAPVRVKRLLLCDDD